MKVLIAEDDPAARRVLKIMLAKWGYETVEASDGNEAWEVLQGDDAPRLVILDWMMPGMDGIELCRRIRNLTQEPYVYVLLLTARTSKEDLIEGMEAGLDDYLTKPFDSQELRVRLRAGRRILDLQSQLVSTRMAFQRQATHDSLTGLPNRLLFSDRLTRKLADARRNQQSLAVMFLDLDNFKTINDTLGHDAGDLVLKKAAERLLSNLRDVDTVARMGGDEFTVILGEINDDSDAAATAARLQQALSQPMILVDKPHHITASIGISIFPSDGTDVETLVRSADAAMYHAKEAGRNRFYFYSQSPKIARSKWFPVKEELQKAIEEKQLTLYYQPQISLRTNKIVGGEALVRWQHPQLGLLPAAEFILSAEEMGLIVPIGEWVLGTACRQNKIWQNIGFPSVNVAVNLASIQLEGDLRREVENALLETGLEPGHLTLEITQSMLPTALENSAAVLRGVKDLGVRVCIEDFIGDDSTLDELKDFPVNAIKLDQSILRDFSTNRQLASATELAVKRAHELGLRVTSEGVETLEHLEFLRSIDCDDIQGYFVSWPVPPEEFSALLDKQQPSSAGSVSSDKSEH